jgi:hypothetical protein
MDMPICKENKNNERGKSCTFLKRFKKEVNKEDKNA